jgi:hypothetical protein
MTEKELIDKIFFRLDDWRKLPAYQLERRADIFFSLYLEEIIKYVFDKDVSLIIPEFPLKNEGNNTSCKVDYLIICEKQKHVYLVELKTTTNSNNKKQDEYLLKAEQQSISDLVKGVIGISKTSKQRPKYKHLISKINEANWNNPELISKYETSIVYILPEKNKKNNHYKNVVLFDDIILILSKYNDGFTKRFIKSLANWKNQQKNKL